MCTEARTFKLGVVNVVVLIALPMVLPAGVAGSWRDDCMHSVPEEVERAEHEEDRWQHCRQVVQVLDRMHAQPRERLGVNVAVMQRMHEAVQHAAVQHSMRPVKVELTKDWNCRNPHQQLGSRERIAEPAMVRDVWQHARRPKPHEDDFPSAPLESAKEGIPNVVNHATHGGFHTILELPRASPQVEQRDVPVVLKSESKSR